MQSKQAAFVSVVKLQAILGVKTTGLILFDFYFYKQVYRPMPALVIGGQTCFAFTVKVIASPYSKVPVRTRFCK